MELFSLYLWMQIVYNRLLDVGLFSNVRWPELHERDEQIGK